MIMGVKMMMNGDEDDYDDDDDEKGRGYMSLRQSLIVLSFSRAADAMMFSVG